MSLTKEKALRLNGRDKEYKRKKDRNLKERIRYIANNISAKQKQQGKGR